MRTLQQRDLDRTLRHELLGREKLKGVLAELPEFRHYFYCASGDEENTCSPVL